MLLIDKYAYINRLKHTHPIEKAAFTSIAMLSIMLSKDMYVTFFTMFVMGVMTIFFARIPFTYYIRMLLFPFGFMFMSILAIVISFTTSDVTIATIWHYPIGPYTIFITQTALYRAAEVMITAMGSTFCVYFLILTTSITDISGLLRKLHVPELFIELMVLTYRFIFIFLQSAEAIYTAQQARSGYHNLRTSFLSMGSLIMSLFKEVMMRHREMTLAIQARNISTLYVEEVQPIYTKKISNWLLMLVFIICNTYIALQ